MSYTRLNPKKTNGTITFLNPWAQYASSDATANKVVSYGDMVHFSLRFKPTENITGGTWKHVANVTPANTGLTWALAGGYFSGAYVMHEAKIENGGFYIWNGVDIASGTECVANITYTV